MKQWHSDLRYLLAASVGALALACGAEGASTSGSDVVTGEVALAANDTATPPGQPTSGPGDSHYTSESKKTQIQVPILFGPTYFAYTPDPPVTNAPLLVYAHGAGQTDPTSYETVLTHFARKGFVVIFPVTGFFAQSDLETSYKDALDRFATPSNVAFAGHSLGAMLALQMAVRAITTPSAVLRAPSALVLHDPAGKLFFSPSLLQDIDKLKAKLVVIQAQTSSVSPDLANSYARDVFTQSPSALLKNLLLVHTDTYGTPDLVSDHCGVQAGALFGCGTAPLPLNAIDYRGYIRPTEGAIREAFGQPFSGYSAFCQEATATCNPVRDMGNWSDDTPVIKIDNAGALGLW